MLIFNPPPALFPPHCSRSLAFQNEIMLTFSQNICGSGFFHHLNEADAEPSDSDTDIPNDDQDTAGTHDNEKSGIVLPFDKSYFSLFYNNSPSQVDPHYQPVSTLTKRGDDYRKKSGTGKKQRCNFSLHSSTCMHATNT